MLKWDTPRGPHSTGVVYVPNHDRQHPKVIKGLKTPYHMIEEQPELYYNNKEGKREIAGDFCVMMGHNRWATVGKITVDNAHPFEAGNIIGSHNGTISDYFRKKLDDSEYYETDSECIFHNIDVHGVENVIPKIQGAWAMVWYNKGDDTFNILRNKERPLFYAWKKNGKVMYYASEAWMIYEACERFGIELKDELVYNFMEDVHYKIVIGNINSLSIGRQYTSDVKGYIPPPFVYKTNYVPYKQKEQLKTLTTSAATSANVFMNTAFGGNEEADTSKVSYWHSKVGHYIEFNVTGVVGLDEHKAEYYSANTLNGSAPVRIYPSANNPDLEALIGDTEVCTFAAKVKKVKLSRLSKFYITLDLDSIMAATFNSKHFRQADIDDEIPWMDNLFQGEDVQFIANGEVISRKEFEDRVSCGCAWCTQVPPVEDCDKITWMTKRDFLCADCTKDEEIAQYCAQFATGN